MEYIFNNYWLYLPCVIGYLIITIGLEILILKIIKKSGKK